MAGIDRPRGSDSYFPSAGFHPQPVAKQQIDRPHSFSGKGPALFPGSRCRDEADGRGGFTIFQQTPGAGTALSWSPDGKAIDFVTDPSGIRNIWRQPLKGGPGIQVTHFDRDDSIHFSWSRGGRLLCTRGNTTTSAIMIQSFR